MRLDLRLHGTTSEGRRCVAEVSVHASSADAFQQEARDAATTAPWHYADEAADWVPDGATITVQRVELLGRDDSSP